jgi:hypothetical protein
MIPPVEERIDRDCYYCIFGYENPAGDIVCKITDALERQVKISPCIYHYTDEEMKELLDNLEK